MDCIDCHNRPTHIYVPPDLSVDRSHRGHAIDATLPFIKQQGVQVLTADYKTSDQARKAIAASISKFYQDKYPQIASSKADSVQPAIAELQRIYSTTFFPEMKVNWKTHPNNIGHISTFRAASAVTTATTSARMASRSARTATRATPCSSSRRAGRRLPPCRQNPSSTRWTSAT